MKSSNISCEARGRMEPYDTIDPDVLLRFVVWASKKNENLAKNDESVKYTTLKSYIAGLKAWHKFHRKEYHLAQKLRPPVMISDLLTLVRVLSPAEERDLVVLAIALVALRLTSMRQKPRSPVKCKRSNSDVKNLC